jgi:protein O-mannosyl-transferase
MRSRRQTGNRLDESRSAPRRSFPTIVAAVSGKGLWVTIGLIALIAIIYAPVRHHAFISLDDPQYVVANARVTGGLTWDAVRWALTGSDVGNWHPLTWMSHMLDVELYGMNAGAHHLTSMVIHVMNAVLLFAVLYRMTGAIGRSAFVAALFAIHPLHVESVAWVAERKDVLSTFFWILTLGVYVNYVRNPSLGRKLAVIFFFALGLMSKPMVVTLPFSLLLLDYWPLKRVEPEEVTKFSAWWPLVREKFPLFVLVIVSSVITVAAQKSGGAVITLQGLPMSSRIGNAIVAYVDYMRDMFWPSRLAVFYPFEAPSAAYVVVAALILTAGTFVAVRAARRLPYVPVGWAWYLGTLIPVIGLVQAGAQGRADRYTYVPLIGLFIILAWGAHDLAQRARLPHSTLPLAAGLAIAASTVVSRIQVGYWRNDLSLWGRAVQVTHGNYRAENHYGVALTDSGRLSEGIEHYTAALAIWPDYPEGHNNLGTARMEQGRVDEAVREFSAAARVKPNDATFRYNLAVALNAAGRRSEAIGELRTALRSHPGNADLLRALQVISSESQQ